MQRQVNAILAVLGLSVGLTATASAGDVGSGSNHYKAPTAAPYYSWSGFYAGVSGGYAWSTDRDGDTRLSPNGNDASAGVLFGPAFFQGALSAIPTALNSRSKGFLGGGQLGYNVQTGSLVWGLETDFSGANIGGSDTETGEAIIAGGHGNLPFPMQAAVQNKMDFFGTFRGRLGYSPTDRLLVYGTGGLAYGDVKSTASTSDVPSTVLATPASGSASAILPGWTVGGGFESGLSFAPNVSIKAEYLYYDLGHLSYALSPSTISNDAGDILGSITTNVTTHFRGSIMRLGLNYKLN